MLTSCCCGGTTCQFFSDDFAVDDLATAYTVSTGSWAISGGTLHTTSSSALLTGNTVNPTDYNTKITADVTIGTSGDKARFYLDGTNWFAEVKAGTGAYIKLFDGSTQMAQVDITRATGTFTVCTSIMTVAGVETMRCNIGSDTAISQGTFSNTGWGLGTGTGITGTVSFDNLSVSITDNSTCTPCSAGTIEPGVSVCSTHGTGIALKVSPSGITTGPTTTCDDVGATCAHANTQTFTFSPSFFSAAAPTTFSTGDLCPGGEDSAYNGRGYCSQSATGNIGIACPGFTFTLLFFEQTTVGEIDVLLYVLLEDGIPIGESAVYAKKFYFSNVHDAAEYLLNVGYTFTSSDQLCLTAIGTAALVRCKIDTASFSIHG